MITINEKILNNSIEREKVAFALFEESKGHVWEYYRNLVQKYGIDIVLKLYSGKTMQSIIKDPYAYIVIASMLEKDGNKVLRYALTDKDFLDSLYKLGDNYYSLFYNIDYDLIKTYLMEYPMIVTKYFLLSEYDYTKLFNDSDIPDEILCELIKKGSQKVISDFFKSNRKALKIFNLLELNTISNLLSKNISFSKEIIMSPHMLEACKTNSLINFRIRINSIATNSGNIDIENSVYNYYVDLLSNYNPVTKMFHQYEDLSASRGKYIHGKDYIVSYEVLLEKLSDEDLRKITSKKISEIVVDYLFKDNIYNVFINIREILSYNASLANPILLPEIEEFYRLILNIDKMENDKKLELFFKMRDKSVDAMFYDDLNKAKRDSYQKIINSLARVSDDAKSIELSNKYHTTVYDYRDKEFFMIVRTMHSQFNSRTTNRRDCYSFISQNHTQVLGETKYIYGYDNIKPEKILHVYEYDAFSSRTDSNETTRRINRLYSPQDLINNSLEGINEIQILNEKVGNSYLALKPTYMVALDEITDDIVNESNRLNVPIFLVRKNTLVKEKPRDTDIRIKASYNEPFDAINRYIDGEIWFDEEDRRRKER